MKLSDFCPIRSPLELILYSPYCINTFLLSSFFLHDATDALVRNICVSVVSCSCNWGSLE